MNDERRNIPNVELRGSRRKAVDFSRQYAETVRELDANREAELNGAGLEQRIDIIDDVSSNGGSSPSEMVHNLDEKHPQRRRVRVTVNKDDPVKVVNPANEKPANTESSAPLDEIVVPTDQSPLVDQRKVENFKRFLCYVLGSEIRLAMVGYVLSENTSGRQSADVKTYQRLKADQVLKRLERLAKSDAVGLYLALRDYRQTVIGHMADTFGPVVHVAKNDTSRGLPFFTLSVHAKTAVRAAQYAYQSLAHQDLESMTQVFAVARSLRDVRNEPVPGPLFDTLFLEAVAQSAGTKEDIRNYLRTSSTSSFTGYNHTSDIAEVGDLHGAVARRLERFAKLGYINVRSNNFTLTRKGRKMRDLLVTLYGFFVNDKAAIKKIDREMKVYDSGNVNAHGILIPRYFESGRQRDDGSSLIERLNRVYEVIPNSNEGAVTKEYVFRILTMKGSSLTRSDVETYIRALAEKGYLGDKTFVKDGWAAYNRSPDKPFTL